MSTNRPTNQFGVMNNAAYGEAKAHQQEELTWLQIAVWLTLSAVGMAQVHPAASETAIEVSAAVGTTLGLVILGRELLQAYIFRASGSGPDGKRSRGYRMFMQEELPQSIPSMAAGAAVPITAALCSAPNGQGALILVLLAVSGLSVTNHWERRRYYDALRQIRK